MVGSDQCVVQAIADTVITCIAPQRDEPILESVIVSHSHGGSRGELWVFKHPPSQLTITFSHE